MHHRVGDALDKIIVYRAADDEHPDVDRPEWKGQGGLFSYALTKFTALCGTLDDCPRRLVPLSDEFRAIFGESRVIRR